MRVVVLGGGGGGNGRAITRALGAAGARVAVVDLVEALAVEAADEVVREGGSAIGMAGDVSSSRDIDRVIGVAHSSLGGIDALVTVVGGVGAIGRKAVLHRLTDEDWDRMMDLNLTYVFRAVRAVLPMFLDGGAGGTILSIGSIGGVTSAPDIPAYGAAKAGLINLARSVSVAYAADGVRMNVLSCGLILTAVARETLDTSQMESLVPMGRLGDPAEVGEAAVFLVSARSSYISGQNIIIDGAVTATFPLRTEDLRRSGRSD